MKNLPPRLGGGKDSILPSPLFSHLRYTVSCCAAPSPLYFLEFPRMLSSICYLKTNLARQSSSFDQTPTLRFANPSLILCRWSLLEAQYYSCQGTGMSRFLFDLETVRDYNSCERMGFLLNSTRGSLLIPRTDQLLTLVY